jgi:hypothetical protein
MMIDYGTMKLTIYKGQSETEDNWQRSRATAGLRAGI